MINLFADAVVAIGQSSELSLMLQATVLLTLGLAAARLADRARASVRHLMLASMFIGLLVLPAAALLMPRVTVDVPVDRASASHRANAVTGGVSTMPAPVEVAGALQQSQRDGWNMPAPMLVLRYVWVTGIAAVLASLMAALYRLARIRRTALPCLELAETVRAIAADLGVRRITVVMHEAVAVPITCGLFRPAIILPSDIGRWSSTEIRRALVHELEHVRRHDWSLQLLVRGVCSLYWFHPLAWTGLRQLSLEAERACDDAVIETTECADYATQLVELASRLSHRSALPTLAMANRTDLASRVSALLDPRQRRGRAGLKLSAPLLMAGIVVAMAVAPLRAVAGSAWQGQVVPQRLIARVSSADRALFRASERGDTERMVQLLDAGANVNCTIDGDGSPLIGAAKAGKLEAVKLLLDRGADPNLSVPGDGNPLIMAASNGFGDIVSLLLDRGASIDAIVPSDENPLIQASASGHLAVVKLLVSRGADVNARSWAETWPNQVGEWRTPLSRARQRGHRGIAEYLLEHGARD